MPETEADTCRIYVLPKLYGAGWTDDQIQEQHSFTDGRIVPTAKRIRRLKQKRADYRLRYTRDFPIAVVEAKASYKSAGDGLQQAKEYAQIHTYSLRQGIDDGFLAPYRVHRIITTYDALGWRPSQGRTRPLRHKRFPTRNTRPRISSGPWPCWPAPRPSPAASPTS